MVTYKVRETVGDRFAVYACTEYSEIRVKVFKTRKGAENWVKKHS